MRILSWSSRSLRTLKSDTRGTSAVEFGMIAPFIFFAVIAMVDLGRVAGERMDMDQVVRAGAESAMVNSTEDAILRVLEGTAKKTFTLASEGDGDTYQAGIDHPISLAVNRYCECPESPGVEADCGNACPSDLPPNVLVDLSAAKSFSGMLLPAFDLSAAARIQLR